MAGPSWWDTMLSAVRAQESGGNYAQDSAGCLGAYCWNDQSSWDTMVQAAGMVHLVGQNPATLPPNDQDFVASANLGRIYGQTHSLTAILEWWNGGQTHSVPNPGLPEQKWAKQCGGGSSGAYACQVETRMKLGGHYLATGSGSGGTVQPSATADCLIGFGGIPGTSWIADIFGNGGNLGQVCMFTKSEARAIIGAAFLLGGAAQIFSGLLLMGLVVGVKAVGPLVGMQQKTQQAYNKAKGLVPGTAQGGGSASAGRTGGAGAAEGSTTAAAGGAAAGGTAEIAELAAVA